MKIRYLIGIAVIIIVSVHLVAAGLAGSQSQVVSENTIIEKAIPSKAVQHSLKSPDQIKQDGSIFSKTTLISLVVAIIGIVAFRRNTYS